MTVTNPFADLNGPANTAGRTTRDRKALRERNKPATTADVVKAVEQNLKGSTLAAADRIAIALERIAAALEEITTRGQDLAEEIADERARLESERRKTEGGT